MPENLIKKIFINMDDWRNLPSYQLERRADIFFSLYLQEILEDKFKCNIDMIIPEFPIRKCLIKGINNNNKYNRNRSYKIDYIALNLDHKKVYFIELKTDMKSLRKGQSDYLVESKEVGFKSILEGINELSKASRATGKYKWLIDKLKELKLISEDGEVTVINNSECEIEIVFILPEEPYEIEDSINASYIPFDKVIKIIEKYEDKLSERFIESLKLWVEKEPGAPEQGK